MINEPLAQIPSLAEQGQTLTQEGKQTDHFAITVADSLLAYRQGLIFWLLKFTIGKLSLRYSELYFKRSN